MEENEKQAEEQLCDYLSRDLAISKLQLNESKRNGTRLIMLAIVLILLIVVCIAGFAATVFFITKEQTKQIQAIFSSDWEVRMQEQSTRIYQESDASSTAIINNRTRIEGNSIMINPPSNKIGE